jgi:uncharacterized surface protein with fasciclin (FAS1) repeats
MKLILPALTGLLLASPTVVQSTNTDIVGFVVGEPDLTLLTAAVIRAGLVNALSNLNHATLFAPTNNAFNDLPSDVSNTLFTNDEFLPHLVDLLLLHVLSPSVVFASDFPSGRSSTTGKTNTIDLY